MALAAARRSGARAAGTPAPQRQPAGACRPLPFAPSDFIEAVHGTCWPSPPPRLRPHRMAPLRQPPACRTFPAERDETPLPAAARPRSSALPAPRRAAYLHPGRRRSRPARGACSGRHARPPARRACANRGTSSVLGYGGLASILYSPCGHSRGPISGQNGLWHSGGR